MDESRLQLQLIGGIPFSLVTSHAVVTVSESDGLPRKSLLDQDLLAKLRAALLIRELSVPLVAYIHRSGNLGNLYYNQTRLQIETTLLSHGYP